MENVIEGGKFDGCRWSELPEQYLEQLISIGGKDREKATAEVRRRDAAQLSPVVKDPQSVQITFGMHSGMAWESVPTDYLKWVIETFSNGHRKSRAEKELVARGEMVSDPKCRKCRSEMLFRKRDAVSQRKAAKKAKSYWYKWWWKCKACGFILHNDAAKVIVGNAQISKPASKQKRTEADWESDHYKFTMPNGKETWIPNGWKVGGPNDVVAPF